MTKLEKEALEKYKTGSYPQLHPDHYAFIHGYLAGAEPREKRIEELEQQIEEMKSDVRTNIKWADQKNNNQMYCKLNSMINQWEIKE